MKKVRKAIIPAAGLGTRFLPATKAMPKEMLPIVDKPTIQYIIEEAVTSGIEDIIIVTGRGKRAIEDHFDKSYELEETLVKKEKFELLNEIQDISKLANIHYIRQKEPLGLGHAIGCANRFIGDEPFAVLLGDDIVYSPEKPALKQLIDVYERYNSSVIGVQPVAEEDVSKYGVISIGRGEMEPGVFGIDDLVEKPEREEAPSNYAIMGRYILRPEIFSLLEDLPSGAGGEIQLTDAIKRLNEQQMVVGCEFKGERHDVGDKFGFVRATVEFALMHGDLKENVYEYLKSVIERGRIGV
jgi:UTP--glucose-1-phosphate uridylyltransferase